MSDPMQNSVTIRSCFLSDQQERWEAGYDALINSDRKQGEWLFAEIGYSVIRQLDFIGLIHQSSSVYDIDEISGMPEYSEAYSAVLDQVLRFRYRSDQLPADDDVQGKTTNETLLPPLVTAIRAYDPNKTTPPITIWRYLVNSRVRLCLMKWAELRAEKPIALVGSLTAGNHDDESTDIEIISNTPTANDQDVEAETENWVSDVFNRLSRYSKGRAAVFFLRNWCRPAFREKWRENHINTVVDAALSFGRTENETREGIESLWENLKNSADEEVESNAKQNLTSIQKLDCDLTAHHELCLHRRKMKSEYAQRALRQSSSDAKQLYTDCTESVGETGQAVRDKFKAEDIYAGIGKVANEKLFLRKKFCECCQSEAYHLRVRNNKFVELSRKQCSDLVPFNQIADVLGTKENNCVVLYKRAVEWLTEQDSGDMDLDGSLRDNLSNDRVPEPDGLKYFMKPTSKSVREKRQFEIDQIQFLRQSVCGEFEAT